MLAFFHSNKACSPLGHYKEEQWTAKSILSPIDDYNVVLGASSFYTANRPILAAAARRYRRDSIFRGVDGKV
jgi:hypothetical protein